MKKNLKMEPSSTTYENDDDDANNKVTRVSTELSYIVEGEWNNGGTWKLEKQSSDGEDLIKFHSTIEELYDENLPRKPEKKAPLKDETVQLFECMPKGFAFYMESGTFRRVVDHDDYQKLCTTELDMSNRVADYNTPIIERIKENIERTLELQSYLKSYDPFIYEKTKKLERLRELSEHTIHANMELTLELPRAKKELEKLIESKDKLIAKVAKYLKVEAFIERVIKAESHFLDFSAIYDRHFTLIATNEYLKKRYSNCHEVHKKMAEEMQSLDNFAENNQLFLTQEIKRLKKELKTLSERNRNLEQNVIKWSEAATHKLLNEYNLINCIHNMTRNITDVRPFTLRRFNDLPDHPCRELETLGSLIKDYKIILRECSQRPPKFQSEKSSHSSRDTYSEY